MQRKRLGIISDCIHFYTQDGSIGTETHIFLYQMEALSAYFSEVTIACPFTVYDGDKVFTIYKKQHIKFIPLRVVGGNNFNQKIKIISVFPEWFKVYKQLNRLSDLIYMRLPDNVSLPAFFYYILKRKRTFITYTGTWDNYKKEAITWRLEKWLLRNVFQGPYWVYTNKALTRPNMHKGTSPSYNRAFWHEQTKLIEQKKSAFRRGKACLHFITVGALVPHKNQITIIEAFRILKQQRKSFFLTIVGDGSQREVYKQKIRDSQLEEEITIAGKKTREELCELFKDQDFVIQMPYQEPYGKVPVEGLYFGLIPILSDVGVSAAFTGNGKHGFLCSPGDVNTLVNMLCSLYNNQHRFINMINEGRAFAFHNTLEHWAEEYNKVITSAYIDKI